MQLKDGHILAHILAATSIGVISAAAFHFYHRQKPPKQLEDQTVVPLLDRNESGRVAKLERFSNYVAFCLRPIFYAKTRRCRFMLLCLGTLVMLLYTAFDQLKWRLLKRQLSKKRGTEPSSEALSAFSAFVLGEVSKCIASCLIYPAIRCKVTIQAKSDEDEIKEDQPKAQKTVSGAIHTIWKREGLLGFFKGLRAQILKTLLGLALLMMVKEKITKTTWVLMLALQRYLSITKTRLKNA